MTIKQLLLSIAASLCVITAAVMMLFHDQATMKDVSVSIRVVIYLLFAAYFLTRLSQPKASG